MTDSVSTTANQAKYRADYTPPAFLIPTTNLEVKLDPVQTQVKASLVVEKNGVHNNSLELDAEVEKVVQIEIDGEGLSPDEFVYENGKLTINRAFEKAQVVIVSEINPKANTALEGLYLSAGAYCTQCEAEGFRRISPFLDRPDVLSIYTVTIIADEEQYPHILANGNLIAKQKDHKTGLTSVTWNDPFPKPSYLFAMVAGDFDLLKDTYTTISGREVSLEIYVDKGNLHLSDHAMESLKKSMQWDEAKYGLEYDLDTYMIVAVDFFNMGAMENKGLNIFNSKYVLADEKTATDTDYHGVESVIAHEYFHNWTGNRVTCRDWFQLSLKEGLTVFRDQQFSADMGNPVLERISHARVMRTMQFAEDAGPMSHPIRPDKVIEMNNFYTVTVYDKGAEVIRMMHSLLGESGFRKGMDLYFKRHDGQAVTCDDFVSAMADANNKDLSKFSRWYSQSGTPELTIQETKTGSVYTVEFSQRIYGRDDAYKALTIPVKYEVLNKHTGQQVERGVFVLEEHKGKLEIKTDQDVVTVLFEDFSAPVKVKRSLPLSDIKLIINNASDAFCRWDMLQTLWQMVAKEGKADGEAGRTLVNCLIDIVLKQELDPAIRAELLAIPSFQSLAEAFDEINVDAILKIRALIPSLVTEQTQQAIRNELAEMGPVNNDYNKENVAQRSLKASLLNLLSFSDGEEVKSILRSVYDNAPNMTERVSALNASLNLGDALVQDLLNQMHKSFSQQPLVFDKICQIAASYNGDEVYQMMEYWASQEEFDLSNPNRIRSLYGAFVMRNPAQFHALSGKGYLFLERLLTDVDAKNPQLAARLIDPLLSYQRYDEQRVALMKGVLLRLSSTELSKDLYEKVHSALAN